MLLGAFITVPLSDPTQLDPGVERALEAGSLLYNAGYEDALIILSDEYGSVEKRSHHAGRITEDLGLSENEWTSFVSGAEKIATEVRKHYALRTVFHPHCGGYVETPLEVDRFMQLSDPSLLGLCLDVGHCAFGGGDPVETLKKYYDRIWHIHFKDFNPRIDEEAAKNNYNYYKSVEEGVFCELGKGNIDFRSLMSVLKEKDYEGWVVLEQDVLSGSTSPKSMAENNLKYIRKLS
jgi:inosose dehydratase